MRRTDREVTGIDDILAIIAGCDVCRLGLVDDGYAYIVPMNFGYVYENGALAIFLHGAAEGKKLDILANRPEVSFEMDCAHGYFSTDKSATMYYKSVMGRGSVTLLDDAQKNDALNIIVGHYEKREYDFPPQALAATAVLRLDVRELTAKAHLPRS